MFFRPLPVAEIQEAELAACNAPQRAYNHRLTAELLARAITPGASANELLGLLGPREMVSLTADYLRAQRHATIKDFDRLSDFFRKGVNDHQAVFDDALAAWNCKRASDYYGKPLIALTQAQLMWFVMLRAAFEEFHVQQPKKHAGGAWLAGDRKERFQWQIRD